MNKTSKGALAAGAAAVLLTGGAGTLAYWSGTEVIGGSNINAGDLEIVVDATNTGCGAWQLDSGEAVALTYTSGDPLVPGDVLTRVCNYTIEADGNHLRATLAVSTPSLTAGTGSFGSDLTVNVSDIKVNNVASTVLTDANDGQKLTATIVATFSSASLDATEEATAVLQNLTLTATQVHS